MYKCGMIRFMDELLKGYESIREHFLFDTNKVDVSLFNTENF
jgi:hypothetical protein